MVCAEIKASYSHERLDLRMRKWYFPNIWDVVFTVIITIVLGVVGGFTWSNDVYWVFLIYIISLGMTNLNKMSIQKIDRKNERKRKKIQKKIDNPRSPKSELPKNLKEIGNKFNYDSCFAAFKFLLGVLIMIILAIISSIGKITNIKFAEFTICFYVDAFLLPLVLILVEAFMYQQSIVQSCKEFLKTLFYKNGKLRIFRGTIGFIAFTFFTCFSIIFTMQEFIVYKYDILGRIIIFIIGILFLGYSFYNAGKQKK